MQNKPTYSIGSVDHALKLSVLLQQEGPLGVTEAASRLGVARSTAHRLLTMLVYHDFAEQTEDRRYAAGSVLRARKGIESVAHLRDIALPHLRMLVEQTGETANVMVLLGRQVHFVGTVECERALRVGNREGRLLPAHLASGGRAILARLPRAELNVRYSNDSWPELERQAAERTIRQTKRRGFAINDQATETGVTAIGHAVDIPTRSPPAALSIAMPTARYRRDILAEVLSTLRETARAIEQDLEAD